MNIDPQDHRERLQQLRQAGPLPPPSIWLPWLALTRGREADALLVERQDDGTVVTIVLHAVAGGRLLRIVGSGPRGWDDALGAGLDPSSVGAESWSLTNAKVSVLEASTTRLEPRGFAYVPELSLACADEVVRVPYFGVDDLATTTAALDAFTEALLAVLARDA